MTKRYHRGVRISTTAQPIARRFVRELEVERARPEFLAAAEPEKMQMLLRFLRDFLGRELITPLVHQAVQKVLQEQEQA